MELLNKIHVEIAGRAYSMTSDESEEYMRKIAAEVNDRIYSIKDSNSKMTLDMATVLAALEMCDKKCKLEEAQSKPNNDYQKQIDLLKDEIASLKQQLMAKDEDKRIALEKVKALYEAKEKEMLEMIDSM